MKFVTALFTFFVFAACNNNKALSSKKTTAEMDITASDMSWVKTTNVYEVNLRQYTKQGTFNAFVKELPRLKAMGVKTLWFMPITPIAQKGKKGTLGSYYAAADYTSINPEYGNLQDFKNLVHTAHEQGFKVIIDWVANHTGWDHTWTKEHPDFYLKDSATNDFKKASGMDDIIELDYKNTAMRKAMIDAMQYWVTEAGIDGFRCDLAFWVELDFWKEAKASLEKTKKLFWLGELDPLEHPEYMEVFDAAYTWTWMHKTEDFYKKHLPLDTLVNVLERYQHTPGLKAWFTTNHDENSWNGTEYEKYGEAAKALAVFSCTWPGVPLIYNGQELPNHKRLQFFEKDTIAWTGKYELADFYKILLNLHAQNKAAWADAPVQRLHTSDDAHVLAYLRHSGDNEVLVLLNLSPTAVHLNIADAQVHGKMKNIFTDAENDFTNNKNINLSPWAYEVFAR